MGKRALRWLWVAAVVVACAPALHGSWVYDDWATAQHPAQDDWGDLLAVFGRDSSAYMINQSVSPVGVTYRPLSMASLIAVQAADPHAPWAHHLVSLLLHIACALGLCAACARLRGDPASRVPWLIGGLFALHPITIEAYAWINGRSDVLAGAFIAALACALPLGGQSVSKGRVLLSALSAAAAVLSKEPAVTVVAALCGAALLPQRGLPSRARLAATAPAAAAALMGAGAALFARALVTRGHVSGSAVLLSDPELVPAYARSLALALEHIVLPLPHAMLCLSHELAQPARALDWIVLLALAALAGALSWRRRFRDLALLGGALVALLPVIAVRNLVWLGFDRYLYMPYFLLCLLGSEVRLARFSPAARRLALRAAFGCLPLLTAASFLSARAYASQSAWLASLVSSRPDDPTGYVMATAWFLRQRDHARAREAVLRAPRADLSPPLSHDLAEQLVRLGYRDQALQLMDATLRAHPGAAIARFDGMISQGLQGRFERTYALARELEGEPALCPPARTWLSGWLSQPGFPASERPKFEQLLAEMRCAAAAR